MLHLVSNPGLEHPQILGLRRCLDEFYRCTHDYTAFHAPPDNSGYYRAMEPFVRSAIEASASATILEVGAGLPTFTEYFKEVRGRFQYHVQDVTPQNREYLENLADRVFIGDLADIRSDRQYDLIFSTFVLEHVSTPAPFLANVERLLRPGGWHVMFCPRYDAPGYLCPSLRHLSLAKRQTVKARLAFSRIAALFDGRVRFWVNPDPSVLHRHWYRDADAVHLVSRRDLEKWHRQHGFTITRLELPSRGWRQHLLHKLLIVSLACQKADDTPRAGATGAT